MTAEQKERVRIVQGHFDDIDKRIVQIDNVIARLVANYEGQIALLVPSQALIAVLQLLSFRRSVQTCPNLAPPNVCAVGLA